jgi:hypothetical protein
MTATMFCDSAGVHALARAHELAAASGSELRPAAGGSPAARILQLLGLDQIVPVYRDVQQSLAPPRPDLTARLSLQHDHVQVSRIRLSGQPSAPWLAPSFHPGVGPGWCA